MVKFLKKHRLLSYFIGSLLFMESILRISAIENIFSWDLLPSFIFLIPLAIIFFMICSYFQHRINYILSFILLFVSGFIFSSQLVYHKIFRIFYTTYSFGHAFQVFEFWKDISQEVLQNLLWIVLLFSPAILLIIFGKKVFLYKQINKSSRGTLVFFIILMHIIGLETIYIGGREENSAYDLYFHNSYPTLSVERLGLITTMRLDLQRLAFGWSPSIQVSASDLPDPSFYEVLPPQEEINTPRYKTRHLDMVNDGIIKEENIEYNTIDIDFDYLITRENKKDIVDMHRYFKMVQPSKKNEYTGKYKGYNLILITAESFSPYAVNKDITPTLYKMVNEGYNFTNFYNPLWGVSTSDGEYVACTSLIPKAGVWSFYLSRKNHMPFAMGNQLSKLGYKTMAYHNHSYSYYRRDASHPNMGYDYKGVGNGLDVKETWPESDLEMMEKTVKEYIDNIPFHTYYMTVSGHMQYNFSGNSMASKHKQQVEYMPYSDAGKAYLATQIELDRALEYLINKLEEAGIADKTLIAISPDHYPYGLKDNELSELAGHEIEKNFELYKSTFILYTKNMTPVIIDKPSSSLDIIPTLSNLLGLKYDSRLLMGRDIFSDSEPIIPFLNKSYITDKGRYNSVTGEFTPNEGVEVDENYINRISSIVRSRFYYSAKILETDYYRKVLLPTNTSNN